MGGTKCFRCLNSRNLGPALPERQVWERAGGLFQEYLLKQSAGRGVQGGGTLGAAPPSLPFVPSWFQQLGGQGSCLLGKGRGRPAHLL